MGDREVDRQLVERAQRGDKKAFELLVVKYQRKLARLLSRFIRDASEVEDVTQETFIKAYRALPTFRGISQSALGWPVHPATCSHYAPCRFCEQAPRHGQQQFLL